MAEPSASKPHFRYRHRNGVTELRLKDSRSEQSALAAEFLGFKNLIEGCVGGQASFEEIKARPGFAAFMADAGAGMETELYVRAEGGKVTRRSVLVLSAPGKVRAVCSWDAHDGFAFETYSR